MLNSALATEAKAKTKQKPSTPQTSHALLDLLICLSSSSNTATATSLLELAQSEKLIENQDPTVQKKAYRLLLRLVDSSAGRAILSGKVDSLVIELADKDVSGPAKKVARVFKFLSLSQFQADTVSSRPRIALSC